MGAIKRTISTHEEAEDAFKALVASLSKLGKIKKIKYDSLNVEGTMKYGLQTVLIKIRIKEESGEHPTFDILCWSDDIWSKGAKSSFERLIKYYNKPTAILLESDRLGVHPIYLVIIMSLFIFAINKLLEPTLEMIGNANYMIFLGIIIFIGYIYSRIRFKYM